MKRFTFVAGLDKHKAARKLAMIRDYTELIGHIDDIEDEAEYDYGWSVRRAKVIIMWNYFYDLYLPKIGTKHKGHAIIGKNLETHTGRKQLVRVMKIQVEKFKNE